MIKEGDKYRYNGRLYWVIGACNDRAKSGAKVITFARWSNRRQAWNYIAESEARLNPHFVKESR